MKVDIVCSVLNGAPYLPAFLESLDAQTHAEWRLWVRDDGSTDASVDVVRDKAAADRRVHLIHTGGPPVGVGKAFGWLLDRVPSDAAYVMCADQDDVWLPRKIERTLATMRAAEADASSAGRAAEPVLVHTDLTVVDAQLRVLHPSFWAFAGLRPEPASLRRFAVHNVTTGATMMLNRPLRALVGSMPAEAVIHDWWCACVAAAFGRVVALHEPTVLYRQHGANTIGARRDPRVPLADAPRAALQALGKTSEFRADVRRAAAQAGAFLERYGQLLGDHDRRFLQAFSRIPDRGFLRRKLDLLRYRTLPEHGILRSLGVVLRG
jgi:hypothetical protein